MAIRRRHSVFDVISEYFSTMEEWAEQFEEAMIERPSWNPEENTFEPLRNVVVTSTEVVVTVDLPLIKEKSIHVKPIGKNIIEIAATMRRKIRFEEFGVTHRGGEFQKFLSRVRVPVKVDMDKLKLRCRKGMLEIHIPRKT